MRIAKPESHGFDAARLRRIDAFLQERYIDSGKLPNAQLLIGREEEIVHFTSLGAAREGGSPVDETSLFRIDRFPGYDLMEGGVRVTAGVRTTLRWAEGRKASLFLGRSMRDAEEDAFRIPIPDAPASLYDPSGLAAQTSDWVVQASFQPSDRIRGWGHATVDGSGDIRRAEMAVDGR